QLQLRLESLKSDLSVRMQALVNQLRLSTQEVSTAGRTVKLMEEQLANEIERLNLGQSTSFRVSQAQQDLAQAQVNEILSRVRSEKNYLTLLSMTGRLFEEFGLNTRPK
ncbi:MAG: hypothetical protein OEW39_06785, partial [Deltaproteobacteria bacterium]|nr:hypothetical protein [Deltaproteobacteria bacterium]